MNKKERTISSWV